MRTLLALAIVLGFFGALLFGSAGRFDLPFVWGYIAVVAAIVVSADLVIDRDLMKERLRPGPGGTDRRLRLFATPFLVAHLVVAGLDVGRFHFSDTVPAWLRALGLAGFAIGMALPVWAIRTNRFFSPVVRIQSERGHTLVTGGPYRFVRHPGYIGALIAFPCGALALGSWWGLAPLVVLLALILRRTTIEDRYLREHLDGYRDYATRVRWRLVPGVW